MLELITPTLEDMWFRERLLGDEEANEAMNKCVKKKRGR